MRNAYKNQAVVIGLGLGMAGLSSTCALAADTVPGPSRTAAEGKASSAAVLEEILVTATKRAVSQQDVPLAITTVDEARLVSNGVLSTSQLQNVVPGVSFQPSGEAKLQSFYVRGVGTYALSAALEPAVGVAVDGVPLARVGGSITDLVDIERVEVLKGPQGTLFGKNATAGVVSIVTRKPELGHTGMTGHVSYGSYNEVNADAAVNVALGEKAAARLTGWHYSHDGFVDGPDGKDYSDKNSYGARLGLRFAPTDDLKIDLTGEFAGRHERTAAPTLRAFSSFAAGPLVAAYESARGIVPSATNLDASFRAAPRGEGRASYGTGVIEYGFGGGYSLTSVTSYRSVHSEGQIDPFVTGTPTFGIEELTDDEDYHQFTQEVRLASPSGRTFEYVAGLFYYDFSIEDVQLQSFVGIPVVGVSRYSRRNTVTNSLVDYAVFGEGTVRLTDRFRLLAGVRYSEDRVKGSFRRAQGNGVDVPPVPGNVPLFSITPRDLKFNFVSWRVGPQFDLTPDAMIYATASRGYKAPGFNLTQSLTPASVVNDTRVNAEKAQAIEAGLKTQWLDRRLVVNAAAFLTTFKNFQTTVGIPTAPPTFVIQNAGEIESKGVELEINAQATSATTLGFNGAYTRSRYTDFDNAACYTGEPTLPVGSPLQPGFCVGGVQTLDGWSVSNAPKWSYNAFARYDDEVWNGWRAFGQLDANYRSSVVYEALRNPIERQGGYTSFNTNFGMGPSDGSWEASIYVRNIGDRHYVDRVRANPWNLTQWPAYFGRRQVGIAVKFDF